MPHVLSDPAQWGSLFLIALGLVMAAPLTLAGWRHGLARGRRELAVLVGRLRRETLRRRQAEVALWSERTQSREGVSHVHG